jgi:hypothetical protein
MGVDKTRREKRLRFFSKPGRIKVLQDTTELVTADVYRLKAKPWWLHCPPLQMVAMTKLVDDDLKHLFV